MFVRKLQVQNFARKAEYGAEFHAPLCVTEGEQAFGTWLAPLCVLLGNDVWRFQTTRYCMCPDTRFWAEIEADGAIYEAEATYSQDARDRCLVHVFRGGRVLPEEERRAVFHISAEEEACCIFTDRYDFARYAGHEQDFPGKAAQYRACVKVHDAAFAARTDGMSLSSAFSEALGRFCDAFVPERFSVTKQLFLTMDETGNFLIRSHGGCRRDLSAAEETLRRFMCFVAVNKFWGMVHKNTGRIVEKPLFVSAFTEMLDEATDLMPCLQSALSLGRQVFLFTRDRNMARRLSGISERSMF